MIEEWRPVPGYEGLYEVSSYGRVRSLDRYVKTCYGSYRLHKGKVLSPVIKDNGYLQLKLYCNGKLYKKYVHRLVAQAFIPNPDNLTEVNHKDEDKTNNNVDNLEWCSHKYNMNFGTRQERYRNTMLEKGHWTGLSEKEYKKKYYQENRDKICDSRRSYYQENKDRICEQQKKYDQENKDKRKDRQRRYYQKNKDRICERQRTYYLKKKEQIQNNVKSLND